MNAETVTQFAELVEAANAVSEVPGAAEKLFSAGISMIIETDQSMVEEIILSMIADIRTLNVERGQLIGAIERADAFVAVAVKSLLEVIRSNNCQITEEQQANVDICEWVVGLMESEFDPDEQHDNKKMLTELKELYAELGHIKDGDDLRTRLGEMNG